MEIPILLQKLLQQQHRLLRTQIRPHVMFCLTLNVYLDWSDCWSVSLTKGPPIHIITPEVRLKFTATILKSVYFKHGNKEQLQCLNTKETRSKQMLLAVLWLAIIWYAICSYRRVHVQTAAVITDVQEVEEEIKIRGDDRLVYRKQECSRRRRDAEMVEGFVQRGESEQVCLRIYSFTRIQIKFPLLYHWTFTFKQLRKKKTFHI